MNETVTLSSLPASPSAPAPQTTALYAERLEALRKALKAEKLDGFLLPMADAYLNEYVPSSDKRIRFLTGFTGSAGFVIVLAAEAAFFTDSRYTLQAQDQLPAGLYTLHDTAKTTPATWLEAHLLATMVIGFDPRLHPAKAIERYETIALSKSATLRPLDVNPIDTLWGDDRPAAPCTPAVPHDVAYAGKASVLKRHDIAQMLTKKSLQAAIITDPASVAWLLNMRGDDVPHTPLPLSRAIVRADGTAEWFIDPRKAGPEVDRALGTEVARLPEDEFFPALRRLGEAKSRVLIDTAEASYAIVAALRERGAEIVNEEDPCVLPRACKNNTEIDGMRAAHRRDGAALVKLMRWLDEEGASGGVTEIDVEEKLAAFRTEGNLYKGPSFATIAGFGANGAIVHYRAKRETAKTLAAGSFLLLDSGGQYLDGTTDVTRTIPIGTITPEMRDRYTRVLKGHIALASIRFPEGTSGADLDVLARQYLWEIGQDYGHGTGHGVGAYLCVHEGPQSISRRGTTPLKLGMVLSNEPGYYKPNHYGIRLENLQYVVELFELASSDHTMMGFEPLTLAPFDRRAITVDMLTHTERAWLNAYHARVHKALRPQLDEATAHWLAAMTAPLS